MGKLIVIMELIMLIIIKLQASDELAFPSPHPPSNPNMSPPHNVHSPLYSCLEAKIEKCEEMKERLGQMHHDTCIHVGFHSCFEEAIPDDPVYTRVEECLEFCPVFTSQFHYSSCLKLFHKHLIKRP